MVLWVPAIFCTHSNTQAVPVFHCIRSCVLSILIETGSTQGKTPGLIQHVLTVLVFWSWVLLRPRLPPSPRSLKLFPWSSILLHGPLDICLDLLPATPRPCKNGTHSTCFCSTGGHAPIYPHPLGDRNSDHGLSFFFPET